nr:MAG TPA: hypothetical protein [Caudoviricetes sp.]
MIDNDKSLKVNKSLSIIKLVDNRVSNCYKSINQF